MDYDGRESEDNFSLGSTAPVGADQQIAMLMTERDGLSLQLAAVQKKLKDSVRIVQGDTESPGEYLMVELLGFRGFDTRTRSDAERVVAELRSRLDACFTQWSAK